MKKKSKIEIIDKIMSIDAEMQMYYYPYWGYCYEDYYYTDYDDVPDDACWNYITIEDSASILLHSYMGGLKTINKSPNIGKMIDMNTIYPKYIMREKKINQLLGLEYHSIYKTTLAEYFPKNINLNEDRDI